MVAITVGSVAKASAVALIAVALLPDNWAHALRPFLAGGYDLRFWLSQAALLALLGILTWGMNSSFAGRKSRTGHDELAAAPGGRL